MSLWGDWPETTKCTCIWIVLLAYSFFNTFYADSGVNNIVHILQEISYGFLDTTGTGKLTVLPGVHQVLSKIYKPAVHSMEDWGALGDTPHGKKTQKNFLDSFDGFMQYVGSKLPSIFTFNSMLLYKAKNAIVIRSLLYTCNSGALND